MVAPSLTELPEDVEHLSQVLVRGTEVDVGLERRSLHQAHVGSCLGENVVKQRQKTVAVLLQFTEKHMLLGVAHDAVAHVAAVERLLEKMGDPRELPPSSRIRDQLREARNLLAVHRDERVLYWRLTGKHTPHVVKTYKRLGLELPEGTIDKEIVAYGPEPWKTGDEIEAGYASVGTVGDMLSLRKLRLAFEALEADLDELADTYRT